MEKPLKVLLVEDSEDDALLLLRELQRGGYVPDSVRVQAADALRKGLGEKDWDIIISDYRMPSFNALQALDIYRECGQDIPFIIVSGKIGEDMAVTAMKSGASDVIMKGNLSRLVPAIERELREARSRREKRAAEEAIRQGKMEWEAVFDAVSDLIVITDEAGIILRANRKVSDYFSRDYAELLGANISQVFYGSEEVPGDIFSATRENLERWGDVKFPTLKGWYEVESYPMHFPQGGIGMVHIFKDVTKRKRMEEEKRVSDRELLALYAIAFRLNSKLGAKKIMGDLLFQLHNMLQIDFSCIHLLERSNLELKASFGLTPQMADALSSVPKEAPWVSEILEGRAFRAREPLVGFPQEFAEIAGKAGLLGWCAVPLKIGAEVIGMLLVAHRSDKQYTEREVFLLSSIANQLAVLIENHTLYDKMKKKAEELQASRKALKDNLQAVRRANIELGRLNAAKNSFIGMASHELKTPITSTMGGLQFLLHYSGLEMTEQQRDIMTSAYEGVIQLKRIVDDLLSISRIESQGLSVVKAPVNVNRLAKEIYESFSLPLSERRINVSVDIDETPVPIDEGFYKLAVRNLLENAIKFTPDGGSINLNGKIITADELLPLEGILKKFYPEFPKNIEKVERFYRLAVADSGIGVPREERHRIFDKFYGVGDIAYHSSGQTDFMSKGSGLGLAIVKGVLDGHEGMVWVTEGADGIGSVFTLLVPFEG